MSRSNTVNEKNFSKKAAGRSDSNIRGDSVHVRSDGTGIMNPCSNLSRDDGGSAYPGNVNTSKSKGHRRRCVTVKTFCTVPEPVDE